MHGLIFETSVWLLAESTRLQPFFCRGHRTKLCPFLVGSHLTTNPPWASLSLCYKLELVFFIELPKEIQLPTAIGLDNILPSDKPTGQKPRLWTCFLSPASIEGRAVFYYHLSTMTEIYDSSSHIAASNAYSTSMPSWTTRIVHLVQPVGSEYYISSISPTRLTNRHPSWVNLFRAPEAQHRRWMLYSNLAPSNPKYCFAMRSSYTPLPTENRKIKSFKILFRLDFARLAFASR
jgi:hypothetical protein